MRGLRVAIGSAAVSLTLIGASAGCAATDVQAAHALKPRPMSEARKLPGIYLGAMAGPWYGPSVRPSSLLLGADWNILKLRWADWSPTRAYGHGLYDACTGPAGTPPCDKFSAAITVTHVRKHDGRQYFAIMKIAGKNRPVTWLIMNTKLGWWQQRERL